MKNFRSLAEGWEEDQWNKFWQCTMVLPQGDPGFLSFKAFWSYKLAHVWELNVELRLARIDLELFLLYRSSENL